MTSRRTRLARLGESAAADFLESRGATIDGRNIRVGRDEIDLVVRWPDGSRAVVEVKTRSDPSAVASGPLAASARSEPIEAFDTTKADKTKRAARNLKPPVGRIDLCAVLVGTDGIDIHWIPNII